MKRMSLSLRRAPMSIASRWDLGGVWVGFGGEVGFGEGRGIHILVWVLQGI